MDVLAQAYRDAGTWKRGLLPPFSEAEVSDIEATGDFRFPDPFRWYLLNVSREVSCHAYRETVECSGILSPNKYITADRLARKVVYDWEDDEEAGVGDVLDGSIWIGSNGCSHQAGLIVKGLGYGMVVDVDAWGIQLSSIFELLTDPKPTARRTGEALANEIRATDDYLVGLKAGRHVVTYGDDDIVVDVSFEGTDVRSWEVRNWTECLMGPMCALQKAAHRVRPGKVVISCVTHDVGDAEKLPFKHRFQTFTKSRALTINHMSDRGEGVWAWENSTDRTGPSEPHIFGEDLDAHS